MGRVYEKQGSGGQAESAGTTQSPAGSRLPAPTSRTSLSVFLYHIHTHNYYTHLSTHTHIHAFHHCSLSGSNLSVSSLPTSSPPTFPLLYFCCICHFHPFCIFDPLADNDEFPSAVQELAEKVCSAKF